MPTYEYRCRSCGHQFEMLQSITEESLDSCPRCDGPVERLIGAGSGLIFKGSGFYVTDYRKDSSRSEKRGGSGGTKPDDGSPDKSEDAVNKEKGD